MGQPHDGAHDPPSEGAGADRPRYDGPPPTSGPQPGHGPPGYGHQPGYGPPAYAQQPTYGAPPAYPPPAYGAPSAYPPPGYGANYGVPPSKSKSKSWITIVVGVVVAAAVAITLTLINRSDTVDDAKGTEGRTLSLPASVDGYAQLTAVDTEALKAQLGSQLTALGASSSDAVKHAQVGVYSTDGTTRELVFIGLTVADLPRLQDQIDTDGVEVNVRKFVVGAANNAGGSTPQAVSPGPQGGFMRCATGTTAGQTVNYCGWGDKSAFALTILTNAGSLEQTAKVTRDFRSAAEH